MRKCSLLLCSILASLLIITACNHSNNKKNGEEKEEILKDMVTVEEAVQIIKENAKNSDFVLLDVRTNAEYKEGHIKNAIQHDFFSPDFDQWLLQLEKGKRYLLYCRTQARSGASFKKLKDAGFKRIQYMEGGYTEWANQGKPIEIPEYKKELDVQIVGDKVKTTGKIKFDFVVTNLDGDPIRKGKLSLQVLLNGSEVAKEDTITDDSGNATYTFDATSKTKGSYHLVCTATHKYKDKNGKEQNYTPTKAYYYFDFADEDKAVEGNATEIAIKNDITADMAKKFYNRNIYGYEVYNREKKVVSLGDSVASGPALVIFISTTCSGCMSKAQELLEYKLTGVTLVPVITSMDDMEDLGTQIEKTEKSLKDEYHLDPIIPTTLYDCKDEIWFSRFKFQTTPKFILVNKDGQIKDILHGSEDIQTILKRMEKIFNLPAFEHK